MRKFCICSSMFFLTLYIPTANLMSQPDYEKMNIKGKLSANSENEDNEPDPLFKGIFTPAAMQKKIKTSGDQKPVSEIENGVQIVKDIIDKMFEKEYGFALLSQHKYMINSCLGFKVSAGEFSIRFRNPVIEVGSLGKITIKLSVNKIELSALKIRMRPCTKIEHVLDPCHFGKKIEIGGEATDISVKVVMDPVARALDGSAGLCFFALDDNVAIQWKIGGLNLKPMQNNLDYLGKEMLEDGLNAGLFNVLYTKFVEISREVIPQYYEECENAYDPGEIGKKLPGEMTSENATGKGEGMSSEKWEITPAPQLKGVLGKLNMDFPENVEWTIDIRTTEDKFITNKSKSGREKSFGIAPGTYFFRLNTVTVKNVPIEKGKETRLKAGILSIVSEGNWSLYDETKKKFYTSGNKPKNLALPVGSYQLKIGAQYLTVIIKDRETVEF